MIDSLKSYEETINKPGVTFVVFISEWCPDCHVADRFMPHLETMYPDFNVIRVNRESLPQLSNHLNIYGVPSFLLYKNGTLIGQFISRSRKSFDEVKSFIESTCQKEGCET